MAKRKRPSNVFYGLSHYVAWLDALSRWYIAMFGNGGRVAQLNHRTGVAFGIIQESMRDAISLEIAKLLDPAGSRVKGVMRTNLTLERDICEQFSINRERNRWLKRLKTLRRTCAPIIKHRNRRIAHTDEKSALTRRPILPEVSDEVLVKGVNAVVTLYSDLHQAHLAGSFMYAPYADPDAQIATLERLLLEGNRALDAASRGLTARRTPIENLIARAFDPPKDSA